MGAGHRFDLPAAAQGFVDRHNTAIQLNLGLRLTVFSGQFCMTGSRLLVQAGIYATVRDGLAKRLRGGAQRRPPGA